MERVTKRETDARKDNNAMTIEHAVKVIQEFEQIIRNKKSNIIWLTYHQGQIFQTSKEK